MKIEIGNLKKIHHSIGDLNTIVENLYLDILSSMKKNKLNQDTHDKITSILNSHKGNTSYRNPMLIVYANKVNEGDVEINPYEIASRKVAKDLNLNYLKYKSRDFYKKLRDGIDKNDFIYFPTNIKEVIGKDMIISGSGKDRSFSSLLDVVHLPAGSCVSLEENNFSDINPSREAALIITTQNQSLLSGSTDKRLYIGLLQKNSSEAVTNISISNRVDVFLIDQTQKVSHEFYSLLTGDIKHNSYKLPRLDIKAIHDKLSDRNNNKNIKPTTPTIPHTK